MSPKIPLLFIVIVAQIFSLVVCADEPIGQPNVVVILTDDIQHPG
jgi:hypothetical protein